MSERLVKELARAAAVGMQTAANRPDTVTQGMNVSADKAVITQEVEKQIAANPELQHITNTEPHWYQKRSAWSAVISTVVVVLAPLAAKYGFNLGAAEQEILVTVCTTIGGLVAAYLAYRAGTASKPLGS